MTMTGNRTAFDLLAEEVFPKDIYEANVELFRKLDEEYGRYQALSEIAAKHLPKKLYQDIHPYIAELFCKIQTLDLTAAAALTLPESRYIQIRSYLDAMWQDYGGFLQLELEWEKWAYEDRCKRLEVIWRKFRKLRKIRWEDFADREWPEVGSYFDLRRVRKAWRREAPKA